VQTVLFAPGTVTDQIFPHTGQAAQEYTTDYYKNKGSGRFKSNYFQAELESRGLINSNIGPELKNFPFYEDASVIWEAINDFMTSFVQSYYRSDRVVAADEELQNWVQEARGPAEAIDFPSISTVDDLIAVLTHFVSPMSKFAVLEWVYTDLNTGSSCIKLASHSKHKRTTGHLVYSAFPPTGNLQARSKAQRRPKFGLLPSALQQGLDAVQCWCSLRTTEVCGHRENASTHV
jgi:hypothetical protein